MTNSESPDYVENPEYVTRLGKLEEWRQRLREPYPHRFAITETLAQIRQRHGTCEDLGDSEAAIAKKTPLARLAGRVVLNRPMGKNAFLQIQEGSERLQLMLARDVTQLHGLRSNDAESPDLKGLEKLIDLGDIIGAEGHLFRTQRGELTLLVTALTLLAKALLPLPDKYSGLSDKELRYRKRWLDLISQGEVFATFRARSRLLKLLREEFALHGFEEVETPILQSIYGGANARPFTSHLNALDQEMFLRISLEIPLKKLLVGGFTKVFEIGKVFRNEGIDKTHNPEFTMCEAYAALWDYEDMLRFVEVLVEKLCLGLHNTTRIQIGDHWIDFKAPWRRLTMREAIQEQIGCDVDRLETGELRRLLLKSFPAGPELTEKLPRGLLINALFEEGVQAQLIQPTHILDHPVETTPLCKWHRRPLERSRGYVERFETFVAGQELCNAYSELNDPLVQREHFLRQSALKDAGDPEAHPLDEEFVEALCHGMPPAGGIGIGIDRLVMLLTNSHSIRDVLFFPLMRPEG